MSVKIVDGPNIGRTFKFEDITKVKIGRKMNNEIYFPGDTSLSMYHARLTF
jgi:hypothetical protein